MERDAGLRYWLELGSYKAVATDDGRPAWTCTGKEGMGCEYVLLVGHWEVTKLLS